MLDNKPNDADHLYYRTGFYHSDLIGLPVYRYYTKAAQARQAQELRGAVEVKKQDYPHKTWGEFNAELDILLSRIGVKPPKKGFLSPTVVFQNELMEYDAFANTVRDDFSNIPKDTVIKQFYISLGIFNLDTTSAVATVNKDNKLELSWTELAGKGKFVSQIPSYLAVTSAPILSYEGGVLHIQVPVKTRRGTEGVFVGKLVKSK